MPLLLRSRVGVQRAAAAVAGEEGALERAMGPGSDKSRGNVKGSTPPILPVLVLMMFIVLTSYVCRPLISGSGPSQLKGSSSNLNQDTVNTAAHDTLSSTHTTAVELKVINNGVAQEHKSKSNEDIFIQAAKSLKPVTDKVTSHPYQIMYGQFLLPYYQRKPQMKMLEIGLGCDMSYGVSY